jgi:hypothetical protein
MPFFVTPVKTGVQKSLKLLDSGVRRNDTEVRVTNFFTGSYPRAGAGGSASFACGGGDASPYDK